MFDSQLSTLITYNPFSVTPHTSLDELVRMLDQLGFHHWPVVATDGGLVGIVSEYDIVRTLEECRAAALAPVAATSGGRQRPCLAEDLMQQRVVTVQLGESPHEALARMIKNHIHSLPVLDGQQMLGIITSSDFLREFSYGSLPISRRPVSTLMSSPAEPLDVDASLSEAYHAFHLAGVDYLPVVQGDLPLGIVSRRGVRKARCRKTARELVDDSSFAGPISVAQLIADAPTIRPGCTLGEAATLMVEHQQQAIAVLNQANRLVGVLSEDNLATVMLAENAGTLV